ncbi:MAG TPA: CapA family protein [Chthoniobacterales bacterium]
MSVVEHSRALKSDPIRLFLCGDVMLGRGIDQILPFPGNPALHESWMHDARDYVRLAETAHGAIPQPAPFDYVWGDALSELDRADVDMRVINLETSITSSEKYWRDKEIHYRMHPRNAACLNAARIDCCCLANNHVLDWGYDGLAETLRTLDAAGIAHAGAGRDVAEAAAPAILNVPGKGRVLVFSYGSRTSGIPKEWGASCDRPGVNLIEDTSEKMARRIGHGIRELALPGDVIVASIHWGGNWGYAIRDKEIEFAHGLIEEGVAVVYGHSSHHVKAVEIHGDGLVLYGCGDFLNDYEGICGYEEFRSELTLMYLAAIDPGQGRLMKVRLVPMQVHRFRLNRASEADTVWLCGLLNELGAPLGTRVGVASDRSLIATAIHVRDHGAPGI